jgi:tetratricopeptide (TPR) repeat protein
MKRVLMLLLLATGLVGCVQESVKESRQSAYENWARNRAEMFAKMAGEHVRIGELDKARDKALQAVELAPDSGEYRVLLGRVLIELGKYTSAQRELEAGLADNPDNPNLPYYLGVALERQEKLAPALEQYRLSHDLDHTNIAPVLAGAEVLAQLGREGEALAMLEEAMHLADRDPAAYELAGRLALRTGEGAQAVRYVQKACTLNPRNAAYHELLAKAYFLNENFGMCRQSLAALRKMEGYEEQSWLLRMDGDCALATNERAEADALYRSACRLQPAQPDNWTRRAKVALLAGKLTKVIEYCNEARRLEADHADANLLMAFALLRQGRSNLAVKVLHQMQKAHPKNVTMYCLMGRAYEAMGKTDKARQCYEYALYLDPGCGLADTALAQAPR